MLRKSFLIALMLAWASPLAAQEPRPITIDDYFAIKRVSDPRVSPDGTWVAFTVTSTDLEKNKSETAIWMTPYEGGEAIRMTAKGYSASHPRWSPDGKYLSFQAARGEGEDVKTQVWLLNRLGGEARQLTEVKQGVSGHEWSPDASRLLLAIRDPEEEEEDGDDEEGGKKKKREKPWVIDRLQFKRDYVGYLDRRRTHLYVFDLKSKGLRQITSGDYDDSRPAWSPDGTKVAFVSNRTEEPDANDNDDIWIVSADNTDKGKTLLQVTRNPGSDTAPAWSPDGRRIAYATVVEPEIIWYATRHLAVTDSDGQSEPALLTREIDRNVFAPSFSDDGASVYFLLEDSAQVHLAKADLNAGTVTRPVSGPRSLGDMHVGPGDRIALLSSVSKLPDEVFAFDGGLRQLSRVNEKLLKQLKLVEPENVTFQSADGTEIEGFIYPPVGYQPDLRYPALLRIHGGPVSQYDFGFRFDAQLYAANGYAVVMCNPRGSSGYGQDFSLAIWQDWGNKDYQDVMAAVDHAIAAGYADPDRLGVGGWSYGGILTNYVITKTDRFQAAITGASEVLYVANYGHDHYQYQWEMELGLPWENRQLWEKISPFNYVENVSTPTLIMGGERDWNVPILNSEQLYQALKRLGVTTKLVVYPGEHHGIRKPAFRKDLYQRHLDWYARYVKGEGKEAR